MSHFVLRNADMVIYIKHHACVATVTVINNNMCRELQMYTSPRLYYIIMEYTESINTIENSEKSNDDFIVNILIMSNLIRFHDMLL